MIKADKRIYKGLEIMEMISKGKISDHQKFNFENNNWDGEVEYDDGTLYWLIYDKKWNLEEKRNLFDMFNIQSTMVADFEFLDNEPEEIEELPDCNYSIKDNRDKINELVRAYNRQIKEKKEG